MPFYHLVFLLSSVHPNFAIIQPAESMQVGRGLPVVVRLQQERAFTQSLSLSPAAHHKFAAMIEYKLCSNKRT